jgi:membrane associated rhomboid family serine protease
MIFPLKDENPTLRIPWMTLFILAGMFTVWIFVQGAGFDPEMLAMSVCNLGLVPGELTWLAPLGAAVPISQRLVCAVDHQAINYLTPILSLFLHGSWGHLLGNALFFWVFGNNVEDVMGPLRFLAFYLVCGLVASLTHVAVGPASIVPTVGASGAISGMMGAYLVAFPRVRVHTLILPIFWTTFRIPAVLLLLWWFGMQVMSGLPEILSPTPEMAGGVAVWAHIGGFVAGVVLIKFFEDPGLVRRRRAAFASRGIPAG